MRFELAIERQRIFALETDVHPSPQRFLWLALWQELLKHDGGIAKLKPAPANSPVWLVLLTIRNPRVLHFEAESVNIESQRGFHVGHSEKGHRLLDVNARSGCDGHGSSPQRSIPIVAIKVGRSRIARKPARIRQACGGREMTNDLRQTWSQTCEPCRA